MKNAIESIKIRTDQEEEEKSVKQQTDSSNNPAREEKEKKNEKKSKESLCKPYTIMKISNEKIIGVPEGKEKEKEQKAYLKK